MKASCLSILISLLVFSFSASAQLDTSRTVVKDSARIALEKLPKQSAMRSLIFPGLGQIHNKRPAMVRAGMVKPTVLRYWKVPVIWTSYVIIATQLSAQQKLYKQFLHELQYRQANPTLTRDPELSRYDFSSLVNAKDLFRRNRDLCYMSFIIAHTVQVVDAYVDAKLFRYDVSDDLGLNVVPSLQPAPTLKNSLAVAPSLKIRLSF